MSKEYIGDGYRFAIGCLQRAMNKMKLPQLEIASRPYSKILAESPPEGSFGDVHRSRQTPDENRFAVALLQQFPGTTDDFLSRESRSSFLSRVARLAFPDDHRSDFQQVRCSVRRRGCRLELRGMGRGSHDLVYKRPR